MKNDKVTFVCSMDSVKNVMPIIKSSDYPRPWLKKVTRSLMSNEDKFERSTSKCPGIISTIKDGYILRAWSDIRIEVDNKKGHFKWEVPTQMIGISGEPMAVVDCHHNNNLFTHLDNFPKHSYNQVIKIYTPWYAHVPKGYKLLQLPAAYTDENRFTPFIGSMEYDLGLHGIVIPLTIHQEDGVLNIEAGTALCQFILVESKNNIELHNTSFTDEPKYVKMWNDKTFLEWNTFKRAYSNIKKYWRDY